MEVGHRRLMPFLLDHQAIRTEMGLATRIMLLSTALVHGGCVPNADGSSLGHHAIRTDTGLATRIMRLSTSLPRATSPCWLATPRARNRGPIRAL